MTMVMKSVLAIALCATAGAAVALEKTAGNADLQNATNGFDARLSASNGILQTAINQIITCNNKEKLFSSDTTRPDRDADGCISLPLPPDVTLTLENQSDPIGLTHTGYTNYTYSYTVPASVKPWGTLSIQMHVTNPNANNKAVTYQIADLDADQASTVIHSNASDGCKSPGSASYALRGAYVASARRVDLSYSRSSTKGGACNKMQIDLDSMQYKKAVLTQ